MIELIVIVPFIIGILIFFVKESKILLPITGIIHFTLTMLSWGGFLKPMFNKYVFLSSDGMIVLLITSFLFLIISFYTVFYLKEVKYENEKIFNAFMILFLASMSSVAISDNLILFWISVEATTITSAPLIFIHKSKTSIEAAWKYVIICSVGIALALLGTFLIAIARDEANLKIALSFTELYKNPSLLKMEWLKAGFVFILIGYGTKMGLAPMHTWLPDAHSEAASPASALLSGALLNTAFLGIFKITKVLKVTEAGTFAEMSLIILGLLSMLIAAVFILKQVDYKRMLAYSSVENMGIIAFGAGIGGIAAYGAIFHLIHHALIKSSLFLSAGNVLISYETKLIEKIGNMVKFLPKTFIAMFLGTVAILGFPPFGLFFSEFLIIVGSIKKGKYVAVSLFVFSLILIVAGFIKYMLKMYYDKTEYEPKIKENNWRVYPQYILLSTSFIITFFQFNQLLELINKAVEVFGGAL
ncbi:hydrogenase [Tepiditoga spiralis]|uniref:Hydrogenase n=1 Tax=Tepiditoga spiralis TaxID=2108365 RepID=A0A7G1GBZ0_9BACT|nr:proton-conducting transporter membrane subunit [Tepiditoga spiralis]BBE31509.1 hydrogenase [Tepiditoga spiralis]